MKTLYFTTPLVLFIILFLGCGEGTKRAYVDGATVITFSSVEETLQDTSCFKTPKIISLETTDVSLLSDGVGRISADDNLLFIFDDGQDKVIIFDNNGKYINHIYEKGHGPGEYVQITDFTIDTTKKQIILLCDTPRKLMFFTYNGEFISEENLDTSYGALITDNKYFYFEKLLDSNENDCQINILETETGKTEEVLDCITIANYLYIAGNSLSKGNNLLYVRRYDNSIYEFADGKMKKKYDVDFEEYCVPV